MISCYESLRQGRKALMGIATLWIILFHGWVSFRALGPAQIPLKFIKNIGYGGVDIFLLLSGFGLYASLSKGRPLGEFFARRASRIAWPYLPFIPVWFACKIWGEALQPKHLAEFLGNLTMTGWAASLPNQFNWYIQALCWFYVLAPVIFAYLNRSGEGPSAARQAALIFACVCVGVPFFGKEQLMAASRLPVFALGMVMAQWGAPSGRPIRTRCALGALTAAGILLLAAGMAREETLVMAFMGASWYVFVLIVPGLSVLLCDFANWMGRTRALRWARRFLELLGEASLEIYLIHLIVFQAFKKMSLARGNLSFLIAAAISVVAGLLYQALIRKIRARFFPPRGNEQIVTPTT